MPLNRDMDIQQYVQNREHVGLAARPEKRSLTPQQGLYHERPQQLPDDDLYLQTAANSRDRHSHIPKSLDAEKLKVQVPNTIVRPRSNLGLSVGKHRVTEPSAPSPIVVQNVFSRTAPVPGPHRAVPVSAFDDTQSIHLDDSTSIIEEQDVHPRAHYARDHTGRESAQLWTNPDHETPDVRLDIDRHAISGVGFNWQAEVDNERLRQGRNPVHGTRGDHASVYAEDYEDYDDGYEQDGEEGEEDAAPWAHTPSRTRLTEEAQFTSRPNEELVKNEGRGAGPEIPTTPSLPIHRKSLSEAAPFAIQQLSVHHAPDRFHVPSTFNRRNDAEPPKSAHLSVQLPQQDLASIQPPPFSSKVSSYHESSSEEDQPTPQHVSDSQHVSGKRPGQAKELDFDTEALRSKTMADLDAIPFTLDPSKPAPQPAIDTNGTPMSLSAKLTNLTKMQPDAQRELFQSLNDTEREQTATWFLEKFKTDMQRLMDVRIARRKVALKFELEVKKRERQVEVKRGDVETELAELKKGGGALISGRAGGGK